VSAVDVAFDLDSLSRTGYRLPTEAEWEYACRAEATTSRYFGSGADLLPRYAWYVNNAHYRSWPVGQKQPNDFGLFDMLGNAMQWCQDTRGPTSYPIRPGGRPTEDDLSALVEPGFSEHILRGSTYRYHPLEVRAAHRLPYPADLEIRRNWIGLRVVRTR